MSRVPPPPGVSQIDVIPLGLLVCKLAIIPALEQQAKNESQRGWLFNGLRGFGRLYSHAILAWHANILIYPGLSDERVGSAEKVGL